MPCRHNVVMVVVPACLLRALASVRVWRQRYRLAHVRPASDHHRHQEGRLPSVLRSIAVAVELLGTLLERIPGAGRVRVRWRGLAEHSTQIAEMGLRRRALGRP
jgi:hypothetical protein